MKSRIQDGQFEKINGSFEMTNYDLNKQLIRSLDPISQEEIERLQESFKNMCEFNCNQYYMLLCADQSYYTIFKMTRTPQNSITSFYNTLQEIIEEFGTLITFSEAVSSPPSLELWIRPNDQPEDKKEVFCYYLFPYDGGIVEVP